MSTFFFRYERPSSLSFQTSEQAEERAGVVGQSPPPPPHGRQDDLVVRHGVLAQIGTITRDGHRQIAWLCDQQPHVKVNGAALVLYGTGEMAGQSLPRRYHEGTRGTGDAGHASTTALMTDHGLDQRRQLFFDRQCWAQGGSQNCPRPSHERKGLGGSTSSPSLSWGLGVLLEFKSRGRLIMGGGVGSAF